MGMHLNVEFFDLGFVHYVLRIHKNVKVHVAARPAVRKPSKINLIQHKASAKLKRSKTYLT